MSGLRLAWRAFHTAAHLLLGGLVTLIIARRDGDTYRTRMSVVSWWHRRLLRILRVRLEIQGTPPRGGVLMMANHISWIDIMVLGGTTKTVFLSKDDVRDWPLIGWLTAASGTLFIKRGGGQTEAVNAAVNAKLDQGQQLTIFPEGTTTDGRDVRPFFSRLFSIALDNNRAIVPIAIRYHRDGEIDTEVAYINDQSLIENMKILMSRPETLVRVTYGEPIVPTPEDRRKQLAERTRSAIVDLLEGESQAPRIAAPAEPQTQAADG